MNMLDITQNKYYFDGVDLYQPSVSDLAELFVEEENMIFTIKLMVFPIREVLGLKDMGLNEFQVFLGLLITDTEDLGLTKFHKALFLKFLNLIFKDYKMTIIQDSLVFEKDDVIITINQDNFERLKKILRKMFNIPELFDTLEEQYNPQDARAARIAKMLEEGRKKVAQQNQAKNSKGVIENHLTVLSIGLQIPPSVLSRELTLYNLFNLHRRFIMKSSWDLDIKCRLAGGSPKESPDNWLSLF